MGSDPLFHLLLGPPPDFLPGLARTKSDTDVER